MNRTSQFVVAIVLVIMGYSSETLIGLQNPNNTLCQNIAKTVSDLGIHKRPVSFTHRGKRKSICFSPDNNQENNIPVLITRSKKDQATFKGTGKDISNLKEINTVTENNYQFPKIYFANARSMNNKKEELELEIKISDADVAIITETWLNDTHDSNLF